MTDTLAKFVPSPTEPTHEHLYTPLAWVSFRDGEWQVRFEWGDCFQYSHDVAAQRDVESPDAGMSGLVLDEMERLGLLPGDNDSDKTLPPTAALAATVIPDDIDPEEFWS